MIDKNIFLIDALGSAKYKSLAIKKHPKGWGFGSFAVEFGDAYSVNSGVIQTGRCPLIRVQFLWGGSSHSYGSREQSKKVIELSRKYQKLKMANKEVDVLISPFCEHKLTNIDKYLDMVKNEAPDCIPVNTPMIRSGVLSKKYLNETHGTDSRIVELFSFDGLNAVDVDMESFKLRHSKGKVFGIWHPRLNCHWDMDDPKRDAIPSPEMYDSFIFLGTVKGFCDLQKGWILKSHADRHSAGDTKGDKLLILSPVGHKYSHIDLITNGKVVIRIKYHSEWKDEKTGRLLGYRYYAFKYGYQVAKQAMKISNGNPRVVVVADDEQIGIVNPAFRQNAYRNKEA